MSLRRKVILCTLSFLATVSLMGAGSLYIFGGFGEKLGILHSELHRHRENDELGQTAREMVRAVEGWLRTGDAVYIERVNEEVSKIEGAIVRLELAFGADKDIRDIKKDFKGLMGFAEKIVGIERPAGDAGVERLMKPLRMQEGAVIETVGRIQTESMAATMEIVDASEDMKADMMAGLVLLFIFALALTSLLVLIMRRVYERPYEELFRATEKVASGDLSYRIRSTSADEFGVIARRFDDMVDGLENFGNDLKRKLRETELFLSVSKILGMLLELKGVLNLMTQTIVEKMEIDLCAIFLHKKEKDAFRLDSCSPAGVSEELYLPLDSDISRRLLETMGPVVVEDLEEFPELAPVFRVNGSILIVPIIREQSCIGVLALGKDIKGGFRADEMDTARILSNTIGAALRNIELFEETRKQLIQLRIVYELSKALTSVYEPDEILDTIASKIGKLINVKGCAIRLNEEGNLKLRSFYGPAEEMAKEMSVPMGKGIAGWVAREGRSLFIEDIFTMPEELRSNVLAARSAIAVPLKKDGRIIGTLGLYDKLNESGDTVSFSLDDLAVVEGVAYISAIAIEKARMQELEKKSEAEILEAKKRMEFLFESVQGGIITLDKDFTITAANKYIERWIDLPLKDIVWANAEEVFHEKGGICPHCAAKVSFEEGIVNSITQSSGLNYADLAAYPIKDEKGGVKEAVVFIQDITERVLYQEEIMGLYREVMQTKEYMEGLINNSADAIVASDISGIVKSWNPAAEAIYGFKKEEAIGKFLPFVHESMLEFETRNIEKIKAGEVLKVETFRNRKDGSLIEVGLTLSPIKDVTGEIIGISGISKDISERKRVEKELIRRNQELSRLFFISSAMRGTLELDRLLRMVLTAVTMGDGLGFNRALLFFLDEEADTLKGAMGVGPESPEEAWSVWRKLSVDKKTLHDIMLEIEEGPVRADAFLDKLSMGIEIPLSGDSVLARSAREKKSFNIKDVKADPFSDIILVQQLGTEAFASVPLVSRDRVIGVLWVDNLFNKRAITGEDMKFLEGFADQVASAIEAARLFQKVSMAEAELENIFRSISDMVFFTDKDYTVRNVNRAVEKKLGLPKEEIVGRKCYEVFHGTDEPLPACPHHKTVGEMKPFVEELEDDYLSGTFITSTAPMFDADEGFQGTVHVVRDITEIKDLGVKLHYAERMAALGEVAAKVAHEIRNPLVSVGGFARRLEDRLEGSLKEYARIISEEVKRLEGILKDILGFVKEARMSRALVDLNEIVRGVLELLSGDFSDRGNRVTCEFTETPLMLMVDPDRIKEAIFNVVVNAKEATEGGNIMIKTCSIKGNAVLDVRDDGYGIKEEDIFRIFDPFFTTRPSGTGLGLAIAKRVIEENNGTIDAESNGPGKGTKFTINLPLQEG